METFKRYDFDPKKVCRGAGCRSNKENKHTLITVAGGEFAVRKGDSLFWFYPNTVFEFLVFCESEGGTAWYKRGWEKSWFPQSGNPPVDIAEFLKESTSPDSP